MLSDVQDATEESEYLRNEIKVDQFEENMIMKFEDDNSSIKSLPFQDESLEQRPLMPNKKLSFNNSKSSNNYIAGTSEQRSTDKLDNS